MSSAKSFFLARVKVIGVALLGSYFVIVQFSLSYRAETPEGMSADEKSFFLNLAVIGGTLLALSFVTLNFFLETLIRRYDFTALRVFRSRKIDASEEPHRRLKPPHSLKDVRLFDDDPLVIFLAFSVGVTWIQFIVPLVLGLSAGWLGGDLRVLADELGLLIGAFGFSFVSRNRAIKKLRPYLTREELLWPLLGSILLGLYFAAEITGQIAVFSAANPAVGNVRIWGIEIPASRVTSNCLIHLSEALTILLPGIFTYHVALVLLKVVAIVSLLVGTYTTNKDMFIFFKSIAAERMRLRWMESFRDRYNELKKCVLMEIASRQRDDLSRTWNDGRPPELVSTHGSFVNEGQKHLEGVWDDFIARRSGTAIWLLDVPRIANWEKDVEDLLSGAGAGPSPGPEAATCPKLSGTNREG